VERGDPISYILLQEGTAVETADGRHLGTVKRVLADVDADIFDGLIVEIDGGERFVDAPNVADLYERLVILGLGSDQVRHLPQPAENPATLSATPDDTVADSTGDKVGDAIRRAWNLISGKY
jgi:hypothetical protein